MKNTFLFLFLFITCNVFSQDHSLISGNAYNINTSAVGKGYRFSSCFEHHGVNYIVAPETMDRHLKLLKLDELMNVVSTNELLYRKDADGTFLNAYYVDGSLYVWYNYTESATKDEKLVLKKVNIETLKETEKEFGTLTKKESRSGSGFDVTYNKDLKLFAGIVKHVTEQRLEHKEMKYDYVLDYIIYDKELTVLTSQEGVSLKTANDEKYLNCFIGNSQVLVLNTAKPNAMTGADTKTKGKPIALIYKTHLINGTSVKKLKVFPDFPVHGLFVKKIDDSCFAYFALKTTNGTATDGIAMSKLNFISQSFSDATVNNLSEISKGRNATTNYNIDFKTAFNKLTIIADVLVSDEGEYIIFIEDSRKYVRNFGSPSSPDEQDVVDYGPGIVMSLDKEGSYTAVTLLDYSFDLIKLFNDFGHGGYLQKSGKGNYIFVGYKGYVAINFSEEICVIEPYKTNLKVPYFWVLSDGKTVLLANIKSLNTVFSKLE